MNVCTLVGRLTKDAEYKTGKTDLLRYTIAAKRNYIVKGQPEADFINCVQFGNVSNLSRYMNKGTMICITGEIRNDNYTTQSGEKRYGYIFIVNKLELLSSTNNTSRSQDNHSIQYEDYSFDPDSDGDIPF